MGASVLLAAGMMLRLEVLGLGLALALGAWVLQAYLLGGPRPQRRRALLRLRPLSRATLPWTLAAVPALLLASWALGEVWTRLVPVPPESFDPFDQLARTAGGRLALTVLAVAVAPVLEEFFFRGLIQRSLERRLGAGRGIVAAAGLFAIAHFLPWVLPLHLFLGLAFGYAVYATRSIWTGVLLHAANNAAAVVGLRMQAENPQPTPTIWQAGLGREWWLAVGVAAVAAVLLARIAQGMLAAARAERLRAAAGAP